MKTYLVAAFLFVISLIGFGFLAANVMSPEPAKAPQARSAPASSARGMAVGPSGMPQHGSGQTSGPTAPPQNYSSGLPNGGRPASGMPGASSGMSGMPTNAALPGPGPGGSPNPSGMPPAVPHPANEQRTSVPVIQPTDLGSATSPTAGRYHQ
jgi:hypothetical protein